MTDPFDDTERRDRELALRASRDQLSTNARDVARDLAAILTTRKHTRSTLLPALQLTPDNELLVLELLAFLDELTATREADVIVEPWIARALVALATTPEGLASLRTTDNSDSDTP